MSVLAGNVHAAAEFHGGDCVGSAVRLNECRMEPAGLALRSGGMEHKAHRKLGDDERAWIVIALIDATATLCVVGFYIWWTHAAA